MHVAAEQGVLHNNLENIYDEGSIRDVVKKLQHFNVLKIIKTSCTEKLTPL
jgi:hypothetical protein